MSTNIWRPRRRKCRHCRRWFRAEHAGHWYCWAQCYAHAELITAAGETYWTPAQRQQAQEKQS